MDVHRVNTEVRLVGFHPLQCFVQSKVRYSVLLTNLVGWHAGAVSFPLSDVILAWLACPPE
jgi:hypothetical protein